MKIIVFDDDPTGSQTVSGCPLLLRWDKKTLISGIRHHSPLLFLLANTRAMDPELAEERTTEICKSVTQALNDEGLLVEDNFFISRGDSTLRGHGVLEPAVINKLLGPFDATIHVPAFFEGGRTTVKGVHLLNGCPVHMTPFAKDRIFGYSTSHLDKWLEEKSGGQILAKNVARLTIDLLDAASMSQIGFKKLCDWLLNLSGNRSVVVDAECHVQLAVLGKAVRLLHGKKRFLFRSAASFLNGLANLPSNLCESGELASLRLRGEKSLMKPGLVMVGSHVPLADEQLELLLKQDSCVGIELPVKKIASVLEGKMPGLISELERSWLDQLTNILSSSNTPVLYTSRGELPLVSAEVRIDFGNLLAELMARLVAKLSPELGYVISKGGITTHALLEKGFKLASVQLKGQLLPGLSIVCASSYLAAKDLPVITFPGNLGDKETLLSAWKLMETNG